MRFSNIQLWARIAGGLTLLLAALLGGGCASIVHGGYRSMELKSSPSDADVVITKAGTDEVVAQGRTPFSVKLEPKRKYFSGQGYDVALSKPGYQDTHLAVMPRISGWYWGNIAFGGLIGMLAVDPLTGAMWNLDSPRAAIKLEPMGAGLGGNAATETGEVTVVEADAPPTARSEFRSERHPRPAHAEVVPGGDDASEAAVYRRLYAKYQNVRQKLSAAENALALNPEDSELQKQIGQLAAERATLRATLNEMARQYAETNGGR